MQVIDDLVAENAQLQQQLTRAEETIKREQQQMRQLVHTHVCTCNGDPLGLPHYVEVDVLVCTLV